MRLVIQIKRFNGINSDIFLSFKEELFHWSLTLMWQSTILLFANLLKSQKSQILEIF